MINSAFNDEVFFSAEQEAVLWHTPLCIVIVIFNIIFIIIVIIIIVDIVICFDSLLLFVLGIRYTPATKIYSIKFSFFKELLKIFYGVQYNYNKIKAVHSNGTDSSTDSSGRKIMYVSIIKY